MTSRSDTGVWLTPSDGRRWRFYPGALSLAFGCTGDFGYNVDAWETLRKPTDLDLWLSERFGPVLHPSDDADFGGAKQLRAAITSTARRAASGQLLDPADIDTINLWASRPSVPPYLPGGTHGPVPPTPSQMLATIAHDAIQAFATTAGMVRECAAEDCHLIFLDTSRPQSRRWCSMSRCGGRAKARTHYARHLTGERS